jgi:hypothetical protein
LQRKPKSEGFSDRVINKDRSLAIVIPRWMIEKCNFDEPPNMVIECKSEGILIKKLDILP